MLLSTPFKGLLELLLLGCRLEFSALVGNVGV